jgi:predicted  nucleic acid-binding Zn-ribbon protein
MHQLQEKVIELEGIDKAEVEEDVREMIGAIDEDYPVILDLESIRVIGPGKFEVDIVNLFTKKRPLIYKLEEGKYIIDIASTMHQGLSKKGG